jgi:vitamin B12/bleomycin/antimicrobial peptide transport system ATP-binding/permease protein
MSISQTITEAKLQTAKVWALALPYFSSEDKWKARGLLLAVVLLNLASVYMLVQLNEWNRVFYDALQDKNEPVFWQQLQRFLYIAFAYMVIVVYKFYITQLMQLRWRTWMTADMLKRWLANKAFYQLELLRFTSQTTENNSKEALPDNPDQRISDDVHQFTNDTVSLTMGLLNAVVTLLSFIGILWSLSGGFSFSLGGSTYEIAGFMVWMALVYAVAGSVVTYFVGRPLVSLGYWQQRYEANFRHHLIRVREHSEAIALDKGESVERSALGTRFSAVLSNYLQLINAQKRLTWFTAGYGQAAVVFPLIVAAPRFFSGAIQLGQLMQISSAFGRVQDALSCL